MNEIRRGLLWGLVAFGLLIVAKPPPAWGQTSRRALAEGRQLMNEGRYTEAVSRFQSAAVADPTNGSARCELGWAAFQAGDFVLAEQELDRGIRMLGSPSQSAVRAACFYNRGRLAEDRSQLSDAENFYQQSLVLRPYDSTVTARLAAVRAEIRDPSESTATENRGSSASTSGRIPLVVTSTSSSTHSPSTRSGTYDSRNAVDGDRSTGWQVSDGGVGEWIRLEFGRSVQVDRLGIVPGYDKYRPDRYGDRWPLNNRVAQARLEWNGGSRTINLADDRQMQWTDLGGARTSWIKIVILLTHNGSRWNDTVISEISAEAQLTPPPPPVSNEPHDEQQRVAELGGGAAAGPVDEDTSAVETAASLAGDNTQSASHGQTSFLAITAVGGAIVGTVLVFILTLTIVRGRRREEVVLVRRAQAAHQAIESEVTALGKAFDHVAGASQQLWARARQTVEHLSALRAALRRTRKLSSDAAATQRAELTKQEEAAIARLEAIAERLEATVVQLASQRAGQVRANDVDGLLGQLNQEIDTAVAADEEARDVLSDCGVDPVSMTTEPTQPTQTAAESGSKRSRRKLSRGLTGLATLGVLGVGIGAIAIVLTMNQPIEAIASPVIETMVQCPKGQVRLEDRCVDVGAPGLWVGLRAGQFQMGASSPMANREEDEQRNTVRLTHSILMQATEVTQGQYREAMGHNPSRFVVCGENCPVQSVTWHDAARYCNALSQQEGFEACYSCQQNNGGTNCTSVGSPYECEGYRLPTEAEWEYAALAGAGSYPREGDALEDVAWFSNNSRVSYPDGWLPSGRVRQGTQLVASLRPNAWGLYDMLGNVWEWTHDWYGSTSRGRQVDPHESSSWSPEGRVLRGGSWFSPDFVLRPSNREPGLPDSRFDTVGFRVVRTI